MHTPRNYGQMEMWLKTPCPADVVGVNIQVCGCTRTIHYGLRQNNILGNSGTGERVNSI